MKNFISFPGLGIEGFEIDPVAFSIFGRNVAWYGIIVTTGIVLACTHATFRARKNENIKTDDMLDYFIFCVLFGIIGARAYYVLTTLNVFEYNSFYDVIAIWDGGIAIYGGLIGGIIAIVAVSLVKKIHVLKVLDIAGPSAMVGQIIGRWGNFVNSEAYGSETTLPWRMGVVDRYQGLIYVHPTFIYESLWNLVGFALISLFYKHKKYDGQVLILYLTWYGFGRMLIEGLRTDSLYIGSFRISQLVGGACAVAGIILLVVFGIITKKKGITPAAEAYYTKK